jgi:hypothetical protein
MRVKAKYHYSERYFTYSIEWSFAARRRFLSYVGHACWDQGTARRAHGSSRCLGAGVLERVHRSTWQWPARVPLLSPPGLCTGYPSRSLKGPSAAAWAAECPGAPSHAPSALAPESQLQISRRTKSFLVSTGVAKRLGHVEDPSPR